MSLKKLAWPWQIPEFLLMAAVVFYWVSTAHLINPVAIVLLTLLILQWWLSIRWIGILLPSVLLLLSSYMMLAVWSEYKEYPEPNAEAYRLLAIGMGLFLLTGSLSAVMIYKYAHLYPRHKRTD